MVPVELENPYFLRDYLMAKAHEALENDIFKSSILSALRGEEVVADPSQLPKYRQCALSGFLKEQNVALSAELARIFGQAHSIDGTPSPWVADIWGVLGLKLAALSSEDRNLNENFDHWVKGFLPARIKGDRLSQFDTTLAEFILSDTIQQGSNILAQAFLRELGHLSPLPPEKLEDFFSSFQSAFLSLKNATAQPIELAIAATLFDQLHQNSSVSPPHHWTREDLVRFLNEIPSGLRRWTWEDKPKTSGGRAVQWFVDNEYHVQNLLYILLGPLFPDITDEFYTEPVGQKRPRGDLFIPVLNTIIEVKYRKTTSKSFSELISEVAEDASLYRSDSRFKNSGLVVFLWDQTRANQEHSKFKEGVLKLDIDACVVISSPSSIEVT